MHVSEVRHRNDRLTHDAGTVTPALSFDKPLRARRTTDTLRCPIPPTATQTHVFNVKMNCGGCSKVCVCAWVNTEQ